MLAKNFYASQNYHRSLVLPVFFLTFFITYLSLPAFAQQSKSTLTARLINIESATKDPFRYTTSLHNGSNQPKVYDLQAEAPEGWLVVFRTEGSQVAALRVDSGKKQDISVELLAPPTTKPGKYTVPVSAVSKDETLRLELEAVVKGSYNLELTTPTGRLSDDVTEGSSKQVRLTVKNTGTLPLNDLELAAQTPNQWSATFEPAKIERLDAGQTLDVNVTINVPDKTIAGDYMTTFTARNAYTNVNALFRMTVKTSVLSGWLGLIVIFLAFGLVYYLIRKYGRR